MRDVCRIHDEGTERRQRQEEEEEEEEKKQKTTAEENEKEEDIELYLPVAEDTVHRYTFVPLLSDS